MKIVLISTTHTVDKEIEILVDLFQNGLEIFHLRKPDFSVQQATAYVEKIPQRFHERVVLHGHHRLVETYTLKGIHFAEARRKSAFDRIMEIRKDRPGLNLSSSFHRIGDIKRQGNVFDYVFLSPVFDSISKKNHKAAFDPPELNTFLKSWPNKVYALGGVDSKRIPVVQQLGFSGAAVLGAVWNDKDPVDAYLEIKKAAETARSL